MCNFTSLIFSHSLSFPPPYFPSSLFLQGTDSEQAASSSGEDDEDDDVDEEADEDDEEEEEEEDGDDGDHSDLSESELVHAKTKAGLAAASKIINSSSFIIPRLLD